ncbi:MAG: hypothetical protein ACYC27_22140 [Armatimonadota bacterium]
MNEQDELAQAVNHLAIQLGVQLSAIGTGNADTNMGAIEFLATQIKEGLDGVASSISELAEAIRQTGFER